MPFFFTLEENMKVEELKTEENRLREEKEWKIE